MNDTIPHQRRGNETWSRYGWIYASIWLVFLVFPIVEVSTSEHPLGVQLIGYGLIGAFAVTYALGYTGNIMGCNSNERWPYLAVLLVLTLALVPIIGVGALGTAPFLCAYAMMAMSRRVGIIVTAACIAATGIATYDNPELLGLLIPTVLVGISMGVLRQLTDAGIANDELRVASRIANDRERVARDVHDVLGHSLTVVVLKAELANRLVDVDPARARDEIQQIEAIARSAIGEIRTTVGQLRATRLDDELDNARLVLGDAGIDLAAPTDPDIVDPRARVTAAWTIREATTNILRHSGATKVHIDLGNDWVSITDNGRGINGDAEGSGLSGLRERVAAVGGTVDIGPGDDGGTRIKVTHP